MECSFFACLLAFLLPDHHCTRLCPLNYFCTTPLNPNSQSNCSCLLSDHTLPSPKSKSCRRFVHMDNMHHNIWGRIKSFFVSVPADLFIFFFPAWTGFSIITWNDVDSAQVCFSITLLQLLMVCIFKEYILHKKMRERGEKQYVPFLKNTKKSSFTPAIGTHPHITSMIYINS